MRGGLSVFIHEHRRLWILAAIIGAALAIYAVAHPRSIIAQRAPADDVALAPLFADKHMSYTTQDGTRLSGWLFKREEGAPLVVCFSGNSANVSAFLATAAQDTAHHYLLLNYRGYGSSEGKANEGTMLADAVETLTFFQQQLGAPHVQLVGFSLGTCVATKVAAACGERVRGLVLLCPFDSMYQLSRGDSLGWRRHFLTNRFTVTADAERLTCPVSVFIAEHDEIVPAERTAAQLRHFQTPPHIRYVKSGHGDIFAAQGITQEIAAALRRHESTQTGVSNSRPDKP